MGVRAEALADLLKSEIEKIVAKEGIKSSFEHCKVVLICDETMIRAKVVEVKPRVKHPSKLSEEDKEKIKEVKKTLKGKMDEIYLYTVLTSALSELKKYKQVTMEAVVSNGVLPLVKEVRGEADAVIKKVTAIEFHE